MTFSKNVKPENQHMIMTFWGINGTKEHAHYLGLPQLIGQAKSMTFSEIKYKVWQKFQRWKEKPLS